MLKTLLKKELYNLFYSKMQNKKGDQRRSAATLVGYGILFALVCIMLAGIVFFISTAICTALVGKGNDWFYFSLIALVASFMGVVGSVFTTYSTLYLAKDNEQLLAMPIPPSKILFSRVFSVWIMGLLFEALIFVPSIVSYCLIASPSAASVIFSVLVMLIVSLFVLSLSCLFGWLVALISTKIKHKNIITIILSLAFLGAYYYLYFRLSDIVNILAQNSKTISDVFKNALFPVYYIGLAATGDALALVLSAIVVIALFALVYWILSRSFIKIATANRGNKKVKYKKKQLSRSSVSGALLRKELKRFTSSSTYMLNCGLGTVFMLFAAGYLIFKGSEFNGYFTAVPFLSNFKALAAAVVVAFVVSMNNITAPSISLEGKNIWILQSMPVPAWQVLKAKLNLHISITTIPVVIFVVCAVIVLGIDIFSAVLLLLFSIIFVLFTACLGLMINLKMPKLDAKNETAAVKQSIGIMLAMFIGWVVILILALPYLLLMLFVSSQIYLLCCTVLVTAVTALMLYWLKNRGTRIFERL